ncbi:MAG: Serine/threonine kinase [Vezdaea aestivalis]|nr:MAG: Serine/threonine kinase [Vezdaea aestivalis]
MADEKTIQEIYRKIEREENLIKGATAMKASTSNPAVHQSIDSKVREGRKNIEYLQGTINEIRLRHTSLDHGGSQAASMAGRHLSADGAPPVPPKGQGSGQAHFGGYDRDSGGYPDPNSVGFSQIQATPRARPNFSKLDLIKYDTPYVGPRIQLMLKQLEFKFRVEKQYLEGIEKMVKLYDLEGDRKSKADAEARRIESNQKLILLKQALKRYEDLHVEIAHADEPDDDSINMPNLRRPLTGELFIRVLAVRDVDHATVSRFSRGPETFVVIKVEDDQKGKTKASRTDKWPEDIHNIAVDKANEIELIIYDKADHPQPIAMLWIRIADIAEEMRRKKMDSEFNSSGWVSADKMENDGSTRNSSQYAGPGATPHHSFGAPPNQISGQAHSNAPMQQGAPPITIDAWFALEPVGQIHLSLSFAKQVREGKRYDVRGLARKGAVRKERGAEEEVHETYGHKFVAQQFYNVMRCALCGDFLRYASGMQCTDCKYTCHKKCYPKVVTKCISTSNAETHPDEEKLNHRIPHRFEPFSNMSANWCCHCGYLLQMGKKHARKCNECGLTCHSGCAHLVPDFCGMSMEVANTILREIRRTKPGMPSSGTKMKPTLRSKESTASRPPGPSGQSSYAPSMSEQYNNPPHDPSMGSYDPSQPQRSSMGEPMHNPDALAAATALGSRTAAPDSQAGQNQRPSPGQRASSSGSVAAAAAATAALTGKRTASQTGPNASQRPPDYGRASAGYQQPMETHPENTQTATRPSQQSYPSHPRYDPSQFAQVMGYPTQPQQQVPYPQQPSMMPQPQQPQQPVYNPAPALQPPKQQAGPSSAVVPSQQSQPLQPLGTGRRIGLDHFNFLAVLGKGNFGKVMLAETKSNKQLYAIKVLKKEFIIENDEVESTLSEKQVFLIANKERHPFLLNLHACFQTETRVYFVMEYISGGDLMLHIQRGQFGTKRAQFYAAEVCLALKYFHQNGVIYRDLKLDNILLTLDGHIKIADYGLCKQNMWYGRSTSTFCGTPEFMAPEILLDKKYGRAVDWWAFGVLIYQMLLQQSPFRGEDEDEIYDAILADEPLYPIHMPRDSVSILQKLLTREPSDRLGSGPTDAEEIMNHAFFRTVNWDDIYNKRQATPFQPQIKDATDTSNFDSEFTSVTPVLTPVHSVLSQEMQENFRGFSYAAETF